MQTDIDPNVQKELNKPLLKDNGVSDIDESFLNGLMDLVEAGEIDVFSPSTLLNHNVYDNLSEIDQGKVDLEAVNLLNKIREIKDLCDAGYRETFQIENLVSSLRLVKERLENISGDVFII